jgi:bloom syndrome protein
MQDVTVHARAALELVRGIHQSRVTLKHCVDVLKGSAVAKVVQMGHDKVGGFGAISSLQKAADGRAGFAGRRRR